MLGFGGADLTVRLARQVEAGRSFLDGSVIQLSWHWEIALSNLSSSAKLTAFVLWGFSRAEMKPVRPTVATLAALTGFKERAVQNHLAEIDEAGFLDREIGGGKLATRYHLKLPRDVLSENMDVSNCHTPAPKCTSAPTCGGSNETSYLFTRDDDLPSEKWVHARFAELQQRIARIDHNRILSRYLWHEKGFIGFMKLGDEMGFEELTDIVCSVATRENLRCTKQCGAIKTWAFFKKEMAEEQGNNCG